MKILQDPVGIRDRVRHAATQQWQQQVSVVHFPKRSVSYQVRGRTKDGHDARGENLFAKTLKIATFGLLAIISIPAVVVLGLLSELGIEPSWGSDTGKLSVKGREECAALSVADAVRNTEKGANLWLAWSHSCLAVFQADEQHPPRCLWAVNGRERPKLDAGKATLTWPDESTATFELSRIEKDYVKQSNGHP